MVFVTYGTMTRSRTRWWKLPLLTSPLLFCLLPPPWWKRDGQLLVLTPPPTSLLLTCSLAYWTVEEGQTAPPPHTPPSLLFTFSLVYRMVDEGQTAPPPYTPLLFCLLLPPCIALAAGLAAHCHKQQQESLKTISTLDMWSSIYIYIYTWC